MHVYIRYMHIHLYCFPNYSLIGFFIAHFPSFNKAMHTVSLRAFKLASCEARERDNEGVCQNWCLNLYLIQI